MLKVGSTENIQNMFSQMGNERKKVIMELIHLVYFMRGSMQYESMKNMTLFERQLVDEFIQKRLEQEAKKMYPQY